MNRKLNIWIIKLGEPLEIDDGSQRLCRAGILAKRLQNRGHNIVFWSSSMHHSLKEQRVEETTITKDESGKIHILLYGIKYTKNVSFRRVRHQVDVVKEFNKTARSLSEPDLIFCSYPTIELTYAATKLAVKHGIPAIVDVRDFWPDVFLLFLSKPLRWLAFPFMAVWNWQIRQILKNTTAVTGITKEAIDWFRKKGQNDLKKLDRYFHLAYKKIGAAKTDSILDENNLISGKHSIYCHMGNLSSRPEFETVVEAAKILYERNYTNVRIVICGRGEALTYLRNEAQTCSLLILTGWVDAPEIQSILSNSTAGLLPYPSDFDFMMACPNKVAEYLSFGLPILSSIKGGVDRILQKNQCGITYENNNPRALADAIQLMEDDKVARLKMSQNAEKCFEKLFDADKIYNDYCEYIEEIATLRTKSK